MKDEVAICISDIKELQEIDRRLKKNIKGHTTSLIGIEISNKIATIRRELTYEHGITEKQLQKLLS